MKSTVVLVLSLMTQVVLAQKINPDKLPKATKAAFAQAYPNATKVVWTKEKADFEASFHQNTEEMSVVYDAKGKVLEVEKEIKASELPEAVKTALKGKKVKEAAQITKDGKTYYEAQVKGKDLFFDATGKEVQL